MKNICFQVFVDKILSYKLNYQYFSVNVVVNEIFTKKRFQWPIAPRKTLY